LRVACLRGRRLSLSREKLPGPSLGPKDLEPVARAAARLWPSLAPMGGSRWTREDIDWAMSFLYIESMTERFVRAAVRARSRSQTRGYLLKALRNQLLRRAERGRRLVLLDQLALDSVLPKVAGRKRLDVEDRNLLMAMVMARLSDRERRTAASLLRGDSPSARATTDRRRSDPPKRTRTRHRAKLLRVIRSVVEDEGLNRDETMDLLVALRARLAKTKRL